MQIRAILGFFIYSFQFHNNNIYYMQNNTEEIKHQVEHKQRAETLQKGGLPLYFSNIECVSKPYILFVLRQVLVTGDLIKICCFWLASRQSTITLHYF